MSLAFLCCACSQDQQQSGQAAPAATSEQTASQKSGQPEAATQDGTASSASQGGNAAAKTDPPPLLLSREDLEQGWIQLFDGETLFGWKPNSNANWSVADGVISADSGDPGLLVTTVPFADYELRCDFRLDKGTNSGIFLRTLFDPKDPAKDCYELNLCDDNPFPTGSFVARKKLDDPPRTEGEWHTFLVRAEGSRFQVHHRDKLILDYTDDAGEAIRSGFIGLQKNQGKVEFRNVFLKPLTKPLFNGADLAGWRNVPGSKSEFSVDDGTIHVANGPGFLETEQTWADFVLQFEARTNGEHLNSGLFFRAMTGTEQAPSNGYELQIHNGYKNGDRTQAVDLGGTGAIVRRNNARWVIPDDNEWFAATLVANGNRMAVWIDGIQVTDVIDDREPDENPRRGSRVDAGHISLQGHDAATDLHFRNLQIAELP